MLTEQENEEKQHRVGGTFAGQQVSPDESVPGNGDGQTDAAENKKTAAPLKHGFARKPADLQLMIYFRWRLP
jgi:hypothetical protein